MNLTLKKAGDAADDTTKSKSARLKPKPAPRRWATDDNKAAAQSFVDEPEAPAIATPQSRRGNKKVVTGDDRAKRNVDAKIEHRNRMRRAPWLAAGLVGAWASLGWLVALAFSIGTTRHTPALVMALLPLVAAAAFAFAAIRTGRRRYLSELAASVLLAGWVVYDVSTYWWTWGTFSVLLFGTAALSVRWWNEFKIGPNVAPIQPDHHLLPPEPEPEPEVVEGEIVPDTEDIDEYVELWVENAAKKDMIPAAQGTQLVCHEHNEHVTTYLVDGKKGKTTYTRLMNSAEDLASALGRQRDEVLIERARGKGYGAHQAFLTVIRNNPVENTRLWEGPSVSDGVIHGLSRLSNGKGEVSVNIWNDKGMRHLMIIGDTGGGKSAAANIVTLNAMSTGMLNLMYRDPKGDSSTTIASRARVVFLGEDACLKAPMVMQAIIDARTEFSQRMGWDELTPDTGVTGWMDLHDEYSYIGYDANASTIDTKHVNVFRSKGIWRVALNQAQQVSAWGSDHNRKAYTQQLVFAVDSKSGSDLLPGLEFNPADLPKQDDGEPVAGMCIHGKTKWSGVPARIDWLPSDKNKVRDANGELTEPPWRTTAAFDRFFNQPAVEDMDRIAIESVLGPAVNGRWVVGPGGTHEFPDGKNGPVQSGSADELDDWDPTGGGLDEAPLREDGMSMANLNDNAIIVSKLVKRLCAESEDGTVETKTLKARFAEKTGKSKSTVHKAIDEAMKAGVIVQPRHGKYAPTNN